MAMLRGAPEPETAMAFMEFVLSDEGQKLWNYQVGAPQGPERDNLRRLPVRLDFYSEANRKYMTDAGTEPLTTAQAFTYHPEWTNQLFGVIRFLVKVMCVETHDELTRTWTVLASQNFPPRATEVFADSKMLNYHLAQELAALLAKKDKVAEARKARELSTAFRNQYRRAYDMAKDGL